MLSYKHHELEDTLKPRKYYETIADARLEWEENHMYQWLWYEPWITLDNLVLLLNGNSSPARKKRR